MTNQIIVLNERRAGVQIWNFEHLHLNMNSQ